MGATDPIRRVAPGDRLAGHATPGMVREEAIAASGLWAGFVSTGPGQASAWHHHGEHQSTIYVVDGRVRMEFGPGGSEAAEAGPGDFLYVPAGAVHREINPGDEESHVVVVRAGTGPVVINVDGPA
jgi:uncharacterized RmlC-like cupin family protein